MGTRIHRNTFYEPLTTLTEMTTSPIRLYAPYKTQIWHEESRRRCNHLFQILSIAVKGFPRSKGPKWGSSIDFDSRPYSIALTVQ